MQTSLTSTATLAKREKKPSATAPCFLPLESITKPTVNTEEAAHYLNRRPQTLRAWASQENGPLRPLRVHGRLGWPVSGIKSLLGLE